MNAYDEAIHALVTDYGLTGPRGHFSISAAHYHALRAEPEAHAGKIMHISELSAVLAEDCTVCREVAR